MATTFLTVDQTGSFGLAANDTVVLTEGTTITDGGISGPENTTAFIYGAVHASGVSAVSLGSNLVAGDDTFVVIGQNGSLSSTGIVMYLDADLNYVVNHGSITTSGGSSSNDAIGVVDRLNLTNFGDITAFQGRGIDINGGSGVLTHNIYNAGSIISAGLAVEVSNDTLRLSNLGLISGGDDGIRAAGGADLIVTNSGRIVGGDYSVQGSTANDILTNTTTGVFEGDITFGFGNDRLTNAGAVLGDVFMGGNDDTYTGNGSGYVTGVVFGDDGQDRLVGSTAADTFEGGTGNDTLLGRDGDDVLNGGNGQDDIFGGEGNDTISGGDDEDFILGSAGDDQIDGNEGDDTVRAGRDDDTIDGGTGEDNIRGDSGDDLIVGGDGRDDMFGGSGNDTFLFEDLDDSGTGAARDRIYDFRSGEDTLDISELVGAAISYIGSANFSGTGGREVRAVNLTNGTLIYIDTNGDGSRDSDIYLIGTDAVVEGDFLL